MLGDENYEVTEEVMGVTAVGDGGGGDGSGG